MVDIFITGLNAQEVIQVCSKLESLGYVVFIKTQSTRKAVADKRKAKILDWLQENGKVRLERLFVYARRKGYAMNRRTFTRDINDLQSAGMLERKYVCGGKYGNTSYVIPINLKKK